MSDVFVERYEGPPKMWLDKRENVLEGEALGGEPSSIRGCGCPTLAREQKKAGQAGLGGLG